MTLLVSLRIAMLGLPPVERALMETVLLQDLQRGAGCEIVTDLARADLIVLGTDDVAVVRALQARRLSATVLLIGESDRGTGWRVLSRPVQPHALLEAVAHLKVRARVPTRRPASAVTPAPERQTAVPRFEATRAFSARDLHAVRDRDDADGADLTRPLGLSVPVGARPERRATQDPVDSGSVLLWRDKKQETSPWATPPEPSPPTLLPDTGGLGSEFADSAAASDAPRPQSDDAPADMPAVLIVGRARSPGSGLVTTLLESGFHVDSTADGERALARMTARRYSFVLLDAPSLGDETLAVCRALRGRARKLGYTPKLVVIASEKPWLRRVFAWLAGCDAWMVAPLRKRSFSKYLKRHRPAWPPRP